MRTYRVDTSYKYGMNEYVSYCTTSSYCSTTVLSQEAVLEKLYMYCCTVSSVSQIGPDCTKITKHLLATGQIVVMLPDHHTFQRSVRNYAVVFQKCQYLFNEEFDITGTRYCHSIVWSSALGPQNEQFFKTQLNTILYACAKESVYV